VGRVSENGLGYSMTLGKNSQIQKFRDKARELGADEREDKFDAALRKVAAIKPDDPKAPDELAKLIGQKDPNAAFGKAKSGSK
jgi:hypothetical protein